MATPFGLTPWVSEDNDQEAAQAAAEAAAQRQRRGMRAPGSLAGSPLLSVAQGIGEIPERAAGKVAGLVAAATDASNENFPLQSSPMALGGRLNVSTDDDPTARAAGLSMSTAADIAGGVAPLAEKGAAGIFGGRLAATADHAALAKAEKMAADGAFPADIHAETGWFQGADKKWRFEIPDQNSVVGSAELMKTGRIARADQYLRDQGSQYLIGDPRLAQNSPGLQREALNFADQTANSRGTIPMKDYLLHDELYAAYPNLREMGVGLEYNPQLRGHYDPATNIIRTSGPGYSIRDSTVLHELQHKIQEMEGFARGGNPADEGGRMGNLLRESHDKVLEINQELHGAVGTPRYHELLDQRAELVDALRRIEGIYGAEPDKIGRDAYHSLAGEVEARNVQKRMNWPDDKRRDIPPSFSQEMPDTKQIVRMRGEPGFGSFVPAREQIDMFGGADPAPALRETGGGRIAETFRKDGQWQTRVELRDRGTTGYYTPTRFETSSPKFASKAEAEAWANEQIAKRRGSFTLGANAGDKRAAPMGLMPSHFDFSNPGGGTRDAKIGNTNITYGVGKDGVEVTLVRTPRDKRGEGSARSAMQQMTREADAGGHRLLLNADPMDKGVSKSGLVDFYRSLGFERNAGRKRDFSTRAEFIRDPRK